MNGPEMSWERLRAGVGPPSQILVRRCMVASRRARPGVCGDWLLLACCLLLGWAGLALSSR